MMEEKRDETEFDKWFSTYGLITSERILGQYNINLPKKERIASIVTPASFYRRLLKIPLKNVLNGIVLQQANDYHLYAQKLYIDYLLSGESAKPPESQGASTREELEIERQALVALGDELNQMQLKQDGFISQSQKKLITLSDELQRQLSNKRASFAGFEARFSVQLSDAITYALIYSGYHNNDDADGKRIFIAKMSEYCKASFTAEQNEELEIELTPLFAVLEKTEQQIKELLSSVQELSISIRHFRTEFYESILRILNLMNMLPEYRMDAEQDAYNRQLLSFDKTLGEMS